MLICFSRLFLLHAVSSLPIRTITICLFASLTLSMKFSFSNYSVSQFLLFSLVSLIFLFLHIYVSLRTFLYIYFFLSLPSSDLPSPLFIFCPLYFSFFIFLSLHFHLLPLISTSFFLILTRYIPSQLLGNEMSRRFLCFFSMKNVSSLRRIRLPISLFRWTEK